MYLLPSPARRVEIDWDLATEAYMRDLNPDVIVLERENLALFSKDETVAQAVNPGDMQALHDFYAAASADQLPGYRQVYSDSFGVALVREEKSWYGNTDKEYGGKMDVWTSVNFFQSIRKCAVARLKKYFNEVLQVQHSNK